VLLVFSINNENTEEWFYLKTICDEWAKKSDVMRLGEVL
jgi:hypothetical protein